jgi:hypothetical protein
VRGGESIGTLGQQKERMNMPVTIHGYGTPEHPRWSVVHWGPLYYADTEAVAEHVAAALNADPSLLADVIDVVNGNDYEHVKAQMIGVMVARRYGPFPTIEGARDMSEPIYCDDCGDPMDPDDAVWIAALKRPVSSANAGESAVLCPTCARETSED